MIDDDMLYAYLDGELPPVEAARVEEALAGDPALAEKLAQQRSLRDRLGAAFGPIAEQPVPAALAAAARPAQVINLAEARAQRRMPRLPQWAAIAATLVAGLAGGYALNSTPSSSLAERDGALIASGSVAEALDNQLASAGPAAGAVQVRLTFRDSNGAICRSFASPAASGVACREGGMWAMRAMFAEHGAQAGAYRPAAADDPALMAYVDSVRAGDPFDAAAEKRAKASGWGR